MSTLQLGGRTRTRADHVPADPGPTGPREWLKTGAHALATAVVFPLVLWHRVWGRAVGPDRSLEGTTELLALLPGLSGRYLRRAFLCRSLAHCDRTASIGFGTIFSKVGCRIDANVYIGPRCHIGLAHLERDVLIAAGAHVTSGSRMHGTDDPSRPIRAQPGVNTLVRVGEGAWVGSAAVVMADVGRATVVGAGAVVARPLPDLVVAAGVPARVIRSRRGTGQPPVGSP
jgi:acetyltransferase-like isoleucine patch superfamily enzyme